MHIMFFCALQDEIVYCKDKFISPKLVFPQNEFGI